MAFSHISRTKYASAILSQGWVIAHELPEARSPKASGTCCHPGNAPAYPRSLPKHRTLFIALVLHRWLLPRAHFDLSRDKKHLILWDALSAHSTKISGNVCGMTKPLSCSQLHCLLHSCVPAGQPGLTIPSWSRVSADITGFLLMHRPGSCPNSLTSSCTPLAYQFAKL